MKTGKIIVRARRWGALVLALALLGLLPAAPALANHGACLLDVEPETSSGTLGSTYTITATLVDGTDSDCDVDTGANDIYFEVVGPNNATYGGSVDAADTPAQPDMVCTIPGGGDDDCTVSYTRTSPSTGDDTIRGWVAHEPADEDTVTRSWTPAQGSLLNVEPETDSNPPQTAHTLTATARAANGNVASGVNIDFEVTAGPNDDLNSARADLECTTGSNGTCTVSYTDAVSNPAAPNNVDTICAWLDPEDDDVFAPGGTDAADGGDCDQEAVNETENSAVSGTDTFGNDSTDAVTKAWVAPPTLTISPTSDSAPVGTCNPFTITLTQGGGGVSGVAIDVEQVHATATNNTTNDEPTVSFCTPTSGPNPSGVSTSAGDRVESPDNRGTAGGETTQNTNSSGQVTIGVAVAAAGASTGAGNVTITAWDDSATDDDDPDTGEPQATATKTWTAATITFSPTSDSASVGTCNAFTLTLRDGANQPISGVEIDIEQIHARATNTTSGDEPTVSFCTPAAADGPNPSAVETNRGDLTETPTDNPGTAGGVITNETNSAGQVTIGVRVAPTATSDGTGTVAITAFRDNVDNNDDPDGTETQATATKTWVTALARTIDCNPETTSLELGATATVSCLVEDRFGDPLSGQAVVFTTSGVGGITSSERVLTDAAGLATASARSFQAGTQSILATLESDLLGTEPTEVDECDRSAGDPAGAPAGDCSDTTTVTWNLPTTGTPIPQVCRTPGAFIGTDGDDVIVGGAGSQIICGRGGNDRLVGKGGNDLLVGGPGGDRLVGGAGSDRLRGGADGDTLSGGDGPDLLAGGAGNDDLRGRDGGDTLRGQDGTDRLAGGRGNDVLNGGDGRDQCSGGPGRNLVRQC